MRRDIAQGKAGSNGRRWGRGGQSLWAGTWAICTVPHHSTGGVGSTGRFVPVSTWIAAGICHRLSLQPAILPYVHPRPWLATLSLPQTLCAQGQGIPPDTTARMLLDRIQPAGTHGPWSVDCANKLRHLLLRPSSVHYHTCPQRCISTPARSPVVSEVRTGSGASLPAPPSFCHRGHPGTAPSF